jgi:catechol 2,3-dioxygenase-like lactoylglutathione lyase family enzyme
MTGPSPSPAVIQHVGICVADLDRAVAWYARHFGFRETRRFLREELQIAGAVLETGGAALEVLAPWSPEPPPPPAGTLVVQLRRTGVNHLALAVEDLTKCHRGLEASGARLLTPIRDGRFFFCADPDGTVLEVRSP